jgi:ketopantoate reductase
MATAIDAKGDLIAGTAADTFSRLAVGTNGQTLVADSTAATGLKWATPSGGGKVLQVVSATYATQTSSSSSSYADTGLTATITPTLATSKVLVLMTQNGVTKITSDTYGRFKLFRGATEIAYVQSSVGETGSSAVNGAGTVAISYLDSPATTSATTYKTQFASGANLAAIRVQDSSSLSSIVLLEIGV